ncbi:MAG: hypothetical protein K6C68_05000 [Ruminococcus sp.]|nr:hypothetical protein [Ruminococcus sp.]
MEDIGKELCGRVKKALEKRVSSNAFMVRLKEEISEGRASMKDASLYSQALGIDLRRAIREVVTPAELPDSTLYYNIAYSILEPLLRDTYEDVNSICADIQSRLDDKAGIHLAPQKADFPAERVRAACGSASTRDTAEHGIEVLERTSENITAAFSDDYMKANADFRSRAGLDTYIERRDDGKCCEWCSKIAGRYSYPDKAPRDIFRRHDNCGCTVEYVCSKGRQDVWSKKWRDDQGKAERIAYADGAQKPTTFSGKKAEELEKRLTNERESGIIKTEKDGALIINMQFFANKNIPKMTDNELKKSIRSWQQRIDEHKAYINNPITHCDNWEIFDERYQFGLIRHWEHEIKTMQADIDAAIKELERRGSL